MGILKFISIYLLSTLKFLFGITGGYAAGYSYWMTILVTSLGMMTSVVIFAYFGSWIKRRFFKGNRKRKKLFTPKNRQFVNIWRKYGLTGIAFFTPILLMPIGGTLIAVSFGAPRPKIILFMLVSALSWALLQAGLLYFFADQVAPLLGVKPH